MECSAKITNSCYHFPNTSCSPSLLSEINIVNFLNTGLILTPEIYMFYVKKYEG